jgi:hypothetical protein
VSARLVWSREVTGLSGDASQKRPELPQTINNHALRGGQRKLKRVGDVRDFVALEESEEERGAAICWELVDGPLYAQPVLLYQAREAVRLEHYRGRNTATTERGVAGSAWRGPIRRGEIWPCHAR